jgi:hypothetical protein
VTPESPLKGEQLIIVQRASPLSGREPPIQSGAAPPGPLSALSVLLPSGRVKGSR